MVSESKRGHKIVNHVRLWIMSDKRPSCPFGGGAAPQAGQVAETRWAVMAPDSGMPLVVVRRTFSLNCSGL